MPETEPEAPGEVEVEGPDPRHWESAAPELWDLLTDLEHLGRALAVLSGPVGSEFVIPHAAAVRFIRESAQQLRGQLAAHILVAYGIKPEDIETRSPFADAGKARAFGAEQPPETPTP